jgi:hypothetical protein
MSNTKGSTSTRDIVKDFTNYKLRRSGYENHNGGVQVGFEAPSPVHRLMRDMGDQFETAYFNSFDDMTNQINVHGDDLKSVVYDVYDNTFNSGIAWGRIVGTIVFSARLSVKAQNSNRIDVVGKLIEWTTEYLEQPRFDNWINQHNGWVRYLQFPISLFHTSKMVVLSSQVDFVSLPTLRLIFFGCALQNGFLQFYKNPQDLAGSMAADGTHFTWNKAYTMGVNMITGAAKMFNTIMG